MIVRIWYTPTELLFSGYSKANSYPRDSLTSLLPIFPGFAETRNKPLAMKADDLDLQL